MILVEERERLFFGNIIFKIKVIDLAWPQKGFCVEELDIGFSLKRHLS